MNYYKFLKKYYNGKEPVLKLHDGGLGYKPPKFYMRGKGIEEDALTIYNDPRRKINEKRGDLYMLDVFTPEKDEETKQLINSYITSLNREEEQNLLTKQKNVEGLQQLEELKKPSKIISKSKSKEKELLNLFENEINKSNIDKYLEAKETPNTKTQLIKRYRDVINYGLDLVINNNEYTLKKLNNEINNYLERLNALTIRKKYIIENNKLKESMKPIKIIIKPIKIKPKPTKKKKYDVLYKELTQKRKEYISPNIEDWNLEINSKENKKLKQIYEQLELGNLNNKIDELQTYIKPEILTTTDCKLFEKIFKSTDAVNLFLSNIYEDYKKKNIKELVIIHTETTYNNLTFNGETFNFIADPFFPIDIIVLTKTKTNIIKKYAIELKYYDKTLYYTGIETKRGKINKGGDIVTYKRLCKLQNNLYDIYKKNTIYDLPFLNTNLKKENEKLEFEDDKKEIKKIKNEIKQLENKINNIETLINNEEMFNEDFNRNIYGFYVSMKFSKAGFNFQEHKTDENDYNEDYIYKHMQKFKQNQNILNFNIDGKINNITKSSGNPISENFNILIDCEVLYCISMKDCILGLNYSDEIRKEPKLINNPFYSHHIFKTSYGLYTDSVGLKLEKFKLIK